MTLPPWVSMGKRTYYPEDIQFQRGHDDEKVFIGSYCSIASCVTFTVGFGHRHDTVSTFPFEMVLSIPAVVNRCYKTSNNIVVGNDVWIGQGASLLNGATVGDGAVIGAYAVVASSIPPYAVAVGNPAVVKKYRFNQRLTEGLLKIQWWNWSEDKIRENLDLFYGPVEDFVGRFLNET